MRAAQLGQRISRASVLRLARNVGGSQVARVGDDDRDLTRNQRKQWSAGAASGCEAAGVRTVQSGDEPIAEVVERGAGIGYVGGEGRLQPASGTAEGQHSARVRDDSSRAKREFGSAIAVDQRQTVERDARLAVVIKTGRCAERCRQRVEHTIALVGEIALQATW